MKRITILLLLISTLGFAQQNEFSIGGYYGNDMYNAPTYMGSLNYEYALNEKFSLNYSFKMGHSPQNGFAMQTPMGTYGGTILFLLALGDDEDYYSFGLLAYFLPEGITFNHVIDDQTTISPYVNPLAMEYTSQYMLPIFESGIKIKQTLHNDSYMAFNFGVKSLYNKLNPAGFIGCSLGYRL